MPCCTNSGSRSDLDNAIFVRYEHGGKRRWDDCIDFDICWLIVFNAVDTHVDQSSFVAGVRQSLAIFTSCGEVHLFVRAIEACVVVPEKKACRESKLDPSASSCRFA